MDDFYSKGKIMKKYLLGLFSLLSTPVWATPIPPSQVTLQTVTIGHMTDGFAPLTFNSKTIPVTMSGCDISWVDDEEFYILMNPSSSTAPVIVVQKSLFDAIYLKSNDDWDATFLFLLKAGKFCKLGTR